jgi:hypothetical protein
MTKFICYTCQHEDLPEDKKDEYDNEYDEGCTTYLVIEKEGEKTSVYHDSLEPEDYKFCRDLGWIETEINKAYQLGLKHGKENHD